jgi:hypothetical protein
LSYKARFAPTCILQMNSDDQVQTEAAVRAAAKSAARGVPGNWIACYAASLIDGAAVAVERWKGEVNRGE